MRAFIDTGQTGRFQSCMKNMDTANPSIGARAHVLAGSTDTAAARSIDTI